MIEDIKNAIIVCLDHITQEIDVLRSTKLTQSSLTDIVTVMGRLKDNVSLLTHLCENERVTDETLHRLNVYKITLGQFQSKLKAFMDKFYGEIDSVVDMEISKYPDMTKIYNNKISPFNYFNLKHVRYLRIIEKLLHHDLLTIARDEDEYDENSDAIIYDNCLCFKLDRLMEIINICFEYKNPPTSRAVLNQLESDAVLRTHSEGSKKVRTTHLYRLKGDDKGKRFVCIWLATFGSSVIEAYGHY